MRTPRSLPLLLGLLQSTLSAPLENSNANGTLESRSPSGSKTVIIQMFQWNWDSIAAECTNFIGPAGYGFVQGEIHASHSPSYSNDLTKDAASESPSGTRHWITVVDRLPTRIVYPHLEERKPIPISKVSNLQSISSFAGYSESYWCCEQHDKSVSCG